MIERASPQLILFPGLGADRRAYAPQREIPAAIEVPEWPAPESLDEPLAHYAERMARRIDDRGGIYLGGYSLGAMVALEAARHLNARGVFMIGGCRSYRQISAMFQFVCRTSARLPTRMIRPGIRALGPLAFRVFERLTAEQIRLMTTMLAENDPVQTRWSCGAIMNWESTAAPAAPIWTIHGEEDEVIPPANVKPDHVVPGGRHLISLTHSREVNRFIAERMGLIPSNRQPDEKIELKIAR